MLLIVGFAIVASQNFSYFTGSCRSPGGGGYVETVYEPETIFNSPLYLFGQKSAYFGPLTTTRETSAVSYYINSEKEIPFTVLWISESKSKCPTRNNAAGSTLLGDASSFDVHDSGTWIFALTLSSSSFPWQYVAISSIDFEVVDISTTPHDTTAPPTTFSPSLSPTLPSDACYDEFGNREDIISLPNHQLVTFTKDSQHINLTHVYIYLGPLSFSEYQFLTYSIAAKGLPSGWNFVLYFEQSGNECPNEDSKFVFNLPSNQMVGNLTLDKIKAGKYNLGLSATTDKSISSERRLLQEMDIVVESIEVSFDDARRNDDDDKKFHWHSWMVWLIIIGAIGLCALASCIYGCSAHFRSESEGGFGTYLAPQDQVAPAPNAPHLPPSNQASVVAGTYDDSFWLSDGTNRISNATTNSLSAPVSDRYMRNSSMEC